MSATIFLLLVIGAFALAEGVYNAAKYFGERPREELRRRLRSVGDTSAGIQVLRRRRLARQAWLAGLLAELGWAERIERLLDQTESGMTVASFLVRTIGLGLVGVLTGLVLRRPGMSVLLGGLFAAIPVVYVLHARGARTQKVASQLPDALDMMARALRAGHALPASFRLVAQECPPPIATEFAMAYEQQNLGLSVDSAVGGMTQRVPDSLDLKLLAVSVKVQSETGGNLVDVLEKIAETMRERFRFHSKLRAITAEARISGIILAALPFVVAVVISLTNPGYLVELNTSIGRVILFVAVFLWLCGVFWMRRLSKVVY